MPEESEAEFSPALPADSETTGTEKPRGGSTAARGAAGGCADNRHICTTDSVEWNVLNTTIARRNCPSGRDDKLLCFTAYAR